VTAARVTPARVSGIIEQVPTQLTIGGQRREASDQSRFDVLDPATGDTLATVANGTVADALACVDAAHEAASGWAATPPRRRSEILHRTYQLMVERVDDLALLISAENGKALPDARGEVLYSAEFLRWYAEEAVRIRGTIQWSTRPSPRARGCGPEEGCRSAQATSTRRPC
jgi:succinate-semialdehyde dehydrogenase/glutarate-semialdehyde dehydrogenase